MNQNTTKHAQNILASRLYNLNAVGSLGFEGLMANILSELTDQAFYVAKSGPQGGSDVRSTPHNLFKVGLEAKRYQPKNKLQRDTLLHKITEASTARIPVDLWILAATCRIDISDREELYKHGDKCGIGVIVFDWPGNTNQLYDLAVICASAPKACRRILNPTKKLATALDVIRSDPDFDCARTRLLDQLTRADVGFESSRLASERWITTAQASLANAKSRLGGHHNLGEAAYGVIHRSTINAKLDNWYTQGSGVAALVGDEGMGKSWALLDWYNRLKLSGTGAPLTVFLTATAVDIRDVRSTIAKALATQTEIRSIRFWTKRLALWERSGGIGVRILILVDGLNENFQFTNWANWFQPLFEEDLNDMYHVIVSCWPNWWRGQLAELANLTPKPTEIEVEAFNDAELGDLLTAMQADRTNFAQDVLKLMRVPRLSYLVAKYRDKLKESGDVTAERVIYEDWKDRLARRGTKAGLTDPEMKAFVANLGENLKLNIDKAITRKDVLEYLSDESGKSSSELQPAVTELSSGAWLKPGDRPNTYRVAADRIPFVLGATLMSYIREETSSAAIDATIADFLDPLKAHSLGAAILRATTTIALIESGNSLVLREALLARWLEEQNFSLSDFDAFSRLAGLDPDLFLNLAERRWLARKGGFFHDEVLIKSFANAADFEHFEAALKTRLTEWLGTAWPDPKVGAVIGNIDLTQETSIQRAAETRSRHERWLGSAAAQFFAPVRVVDHDGWSWLSHRALAILSYRSRAPFVCVLEAWALSRAIMGWARHEEEVAWILRVNSKDLSQGTEAVLSSITRLNERQDPICDQATAYLKIALSHVGRASEPLTVEGDLEEAPAHMDVSSMVAEEIYKSAVHYLSPFAWKRYDPETGGVLINAMIERGLDENGVALDLLVDNLTDLLIVLTPDNRDRLRQVLVQEQEAIQDDNEASKRLTAKFQWAKILLELYDAEPAVQSSLILSCAMVPGHDEWWSFCRPITLEDIAQVDVRVVAGDRLARWLDYVAKRLPHKNIGKLEFLCDLITDCDNIVRQQALILAALGPNLPALKLFANSKFSTPPNEDEQPNREHERWRNRALLEFCEYSPDGSMCERLNPECIALIAKQRPTDSAALDKFNQYLRSQFDALRTATSWSSPHYWDSYKEVVRALAEHDLNAVLEWLVPWIEDGGGRPGIALMDRFPIIDTMHALSEKAPEISLKLYDVLMNSPEKHIFSTDEIAKFPFEIHAVRRSDELCDEMLRRAKTDKELLAIVCAAHKFARLEWLFNWIETLEKSTLPADVAKAYTLLGCCDKSDRAEAFWETFRARPPLDGWLKFIMKKSAHDYARNCTARDVLTLFWTSESPSVVRHAMKRVEESCDLRITLWINEIEPMWEDWPNDRRYARSLAATAFEQAIKKDKESRKKKLFYTPVTYSIMAPWK